MIETRTQKKWTVHLIHHTHTDIGYTESQGRIARFHADFLDQVLETARRIREGDASLAGFRWTNECFWSIEQWLARHGPERGAELAECIREGVLELTGTYLHFTELVDAPLLRAALGRSGAFARDHGLPPPDTAVSADINGFGRGYAQALHDAGIHNLMTCVHSHHGLAPLGKRQVPFFWETPGGQEILVWNGEHYILGNSLGLAPGAMHTYLFEDEFTPHSRQTDNHEVALKRLPRYLRQLELDGYPYDFVPVHISGAMTDNSPPSEAIIRFVHEWNGSHGDVIHLRMSSASEFCRQVRAHPSPIPRHHGDWPDWWSDGLASTPDETRLAREAMRSLRWLRRLAKHRDIALPEKETASLEQNALLYVEHTFNHSDAMSTPWDLTTKAVGNNKKATASAAYEASIAVRDSVFRSLGEMPNTAPDATGERMRYKVINPADETVTDLVRLYLESKDFDRIPFDPVVTDLSSNTIVPCVTSPAPRGRSFDFPLTLEAGREAVFELGAGLSTLRSTRRHFTELAVTDDVEGAETAGRNFRADATGVETPSLRLVFNAAGEIISLIDKPSGAELLQADRRHAPFTPVYDVTPAHGRKQDDVRRSFGRNRKGANARHCDGVPRAPRFPTGGDFRIPVEIDYVVEGVVWLTVCLFIWRDLPRIDVAVRLQKTSVWDAENLYLALPFAAPGGELWIDKPGGALRPWRDQLPDTLTDWFCIQEGFASCGPDLGIAVTTPDAPLLQLGPLEFGKRRLMGHPDLATESGRPYSWLMTNYWETNFDANLGGFHEFNYHIEFGRHLADPERAIRHCGMLNHGLKSFRISSGSPRP
jgi:hypothetical protein